MSENALFGALSLCRKAGKLTMGFDAVCEDVYKGKVSLVLLAQDLSPKSANRLKNDCGDLVEIMEMPLTQTQLCMISRKPVGIYGVRDDNLAALCKKHLMNSGE